MKKLNIISLFDGISNGQIALNNLTNNYQWFASEIDNNAINITKSNFPNTIHIGDVRNITSKSLPNNIDVLIGGSPCTDFSKNGSKKGMVTSDNVEINNLNHYLNLKKNNTTFYGQSYLFWEYVRLLNELKPNYFILENVIMDKKWINIISNELNVLPIHINSKNFTAQNRDRLYWTNIPINLPIPNNNINLNQIIPNAIGGFGFRGKKINGKYVRISTTRKDGKANCITTAHNCSYVKLSDNSYRKLSINELESLQGIPINYVDNSKISNSVKLKLIGNSFTVDVINYLFLNLFQNHENKIQKSNQTTRMVV